MSQDSSARGASRSVRRTPSPSRGRAGAGPRGTSASRPAARPSSPGSGFSSRGTGARLVGASIARVESGESRRSVTTAGRLLALVGIVLVLAVMLVPTVRRWHDQRQEIAATSAGIATQQAQLNQLSQRRAAWNDPAYVEQQIRSRLHFVKPGETAFITISGTGQTESSAAERIVAQSGTGTTQPWYAEVWDSLGAADTQGATK